MEEQDERVSGPSLRKPTARLDGRRTYERFTIELRGPYTVSLNETQRAYIQEFDRRLHALREEMKATLPAGWNIKLLIYDGDC